MELYSSKPEHDQEILNNLAKLALTHVKSSEGRLALLDPDPEKYPDQLQYHLEGSPNPVAIIESIAQIVEPRFDKLLEVINQAEENPRREISRIGELFKDNANLIIVTNHGNLIDIALIEAAFYSVLKKAEQRFKTGIIISKMVSLLGYKIGNDVASCTEVLKTLCDDIFLSYPRSETIKRSGISKLFPSEINRHNKLLREAISKQLNSGSLLLALAPSGSRDKETSRDNYALGKINAGTIAIMSHPHSFVLPVAVWLGENEPFIEICDIPKKITNSEEAHQIMITIADSLNRNINGKNFYYTDSITTK